MPMVKANEKYFNVGPPKKNVDNTIIRSEERRGEKKIICKYTITNSKQNKKRQFNKFSFFFQAEDGIRDGHVTGVQTCALPISFLIRSSRFKPSVKETPEATKTDE